MIGLPIDLVPELHAEFKAGWQAKQVMAKIEADKAARLNQASVKAMDGVGRLRLRVPGDAYHFWGQKLGYDCWSDPAFLANFERDNPELKANCTGTRVQVGWQPEKRFVKKYA